MAESRLKSFARTIYGATLTFGNQNERFVNSISNLKLVSVLCIHSVSNAENIANPPLDVALFQKFLDYSVLNYQITTFGNLSNLDPEGLPALILSFDDGYGDFIEFAAPELAARGIKANLNVIPSSIESGRPPLNVLVQDFIGTAPNELIQKLDIPMYFGTSYSGDRLEFGLSVSKHIKDMQIEKQAEISAELQNQLYSFQEFQATRMLTLSELKELAYLVELGSHSFEHATMSRESDLYFEMDLLRCKRYFVENFKDETRIYAFPNGGFRGSQLRIAQNMGFENLLLTEGGFSSSNSNIHPRFQLYGNSLKELILRAQGRWRGAPRVRPGDYSDSRYL